MRKIFALISEANPTKNSGLANPNSFATVLSLQHRNELKMEQPIGAKSWVPVPQHRQWGFEERRPEVLKVLIDLRLKELQRTYHPPPERGGPSLPSILSHHKQAKASDSSCSGYLEIITTNFRQDLQTGGEQSSGSYVPELFVRLLPQAHFVFMDYL